MQTAHALSRDPKEKDPNMSFIRHVLELIAIFKVDRLWGLQGTENAFNEI